MKQCPQRTHLRAHLGEFSPQRGIRQDIGAPGLDLRGYFVWTLMDNWEWAAGSRERFGLVRVDFDTLKRTPKRSYRWLQQLIASRS